MKVDIITLVLTIAAIIMAPKAIIIASELLTFLNEYYGQLFF